MKLKDFKSVIYDNVCIYKQTADMMYDDLYSGQLSSAPQELLDMEVGIIGAKQKNLLDIEVR